MESLAVDPEDPRFHALIRALRALIRFHCASDQPPGQGLDDLLNRAIADIDRRLGRQMDEILHNERFKRLETAWLGLGVLVDRVDFDENISVHVLQATKAELEEDFEEAVENRHSGYGRHVTSAVDGQNRDLIFGVVIANHAFGLGAKDRYLLRNLADVAKLAAVPLIAGAGPDLFDGDRDASDFGNLPFIRRLDRMFEGPRYMMWRQLCRGEDSQYVGLCLPRFLLRCNYSADDEDVAAFDYDERWQDRHGALPWGNAALALGARVAHSFARCRWFHHITGGDGDGNVVDLPIWYREFLDDTLVIGPTEVLISERREFEIAEQGFISMQLRMEGYDPWFPSANTLHAAGANARAEDDSVAGITSLGDLFMVTRVAAYLRSIWREKIGLEWDLERVEGELQRWLAQYTGGVGGADETHPGGLFSEARLKLQEVRTEDSSWHMFELQVVPGGGLTGDGSGIFLRGRLEHAFDEEQRRWLLNLPLDETQPGLYVADLTEPADLSRRPDHDLADPHPVVIPIEQTRPGPGGGRVEGPGDTPRPRARRRVRVGGNHRWPPWVMLLVMVVGGFWLYMFMDGLEDGEDTEESGKSGESFGEIVKLVGPPSPLFSAAKACDLKGTRRLLAEGEEVNSRHADVHAKKPSIESPLSTAVKHSCAEVARQLISSGADVDFARGYLGTGGTVLVTAIQGTDPSIAAALVEGGANVNKASNGKTPIQSAIEHFPIIGDFDLGRHGKRADDHLRLIKLLLARGARVDVLTHDGYTLQGQVLERFGRVTGPGAAFYRRKKSELLALLRARAARDAGGRTR